jgi:hypothetical protein
VLTTDYLKNFSQPDKIRRIRPYGEQPGYYSIRESVDVSQPIRKSVDIYLSQSRVCKLALSSNQKGVLAEPSLPIRACAEMKLRWNLANIPDGVLYIGSSVQPSRELPGLNFKFWAGGRYVDIAESILY